MTTSHLSPYRDFWNIGKELIDLIIILKVCHKFWYARWSISSNYGSHLHHTSTLETFSSLLINLNKCFDIKNQPSYQTAEKIPSHLSSPKILCYKVSVFCCWHPINQQTFRTLKDNIMFYGWMDWRDNPDFPVYGKCKFIHLPNISHSVVEHSHISLFNSVLHLFDKNSFKQINSLG